MDQLLIALTHKGFLENKGFCPGPYRSNKCDALLLTQLPSLKSPSWSGKWRRSGLRRRRMWGRRLEEPRPPRRTSPQPRGCRLGPQSAGGMHITVFRVCKKWSFMDKIYSRIGQAGRGWEATPFAWCGEWSAGRCWQRRPPARSQGTREWSPEKEVCVK